jgi:hypothetical protein
VRVGDDEAVLRDDEARAQAEGAQRPSRLLGVALAPRLAAARLPGLLVGHEAAEELEERIVLGQAGQLLLAAPTGARVDVDHRGAVALHEVGEVGQHLGRSPGRHVLFRPLGRGGRLRSRGLGLCLGREADRKERAEEGCLQAFHGVGIGLCQG